ncbi:MAG: hypothetical protein JWP73_2192 [Phenylobacterium sp.]|nr:hypothetical protein [Phenylobacterium sp.]
MTSRRSLQSQHDPIHHAAEIVPDIAAPDAENAKSMPAKDAVADSIMFRLDILAVLEAVDLNRQAAREADEVEVVTAERELAANVDAALA